MDVEKFKTIVSIISASSQKFCNTAVVTQTTGITLCSKQVSYMRSVQFQIKSGHHGNFKSETLGKQQLGDADVLVNAGVLLTSSSIITS